MNIYLIPILTIVAAWITISLPVYLLFQPKRFQTIWNTLSAEISKLILGEMNAQSVTDKLINPATLAELTPTIETHIDQFLRVKLLEKMPFLSTFLGESTLAKLKVGMMEEIELLLPEVMVQYINKTSAGDDASSLMQEKLQGVDVFQMANTIRVSLSAKITAMKWLVVCIGAIIGLLQLAILLA